MSNNTLSVSVDNSCSKTCTVIVLSIVFPFVTICLSIGIIVHVFRSREKRREDRDNQQIVYNIQNILSSRDFVRKDRVKCIKTLGDVETDVERTAWPGEYDLLSTASRLLTLFFLLYPQDHFVCFTDPFWPGSGLDLEWYYAPCCSRGGSLRLGQFPVDVFRLFV